MVMAQSCGPPQTEWLPGRAAACRDPFGAVPSRAMGRPAPEALAVCSCSLGEPQGVGMQLGPWVAAELAVPCRAEGPQGLWVWKAAYQPGGIIVEPWGLVLFAPLGFGLILDLLLFSVLPFGMGVSVRHLSHHCILEACNILDFTGLQLVSHTYLI